MIAAVVVTYRRPEMLMRCIDAVLEQGPDLTVIVVDNGPDPNPALLAGRERVIYDHVGDNIGPAGGFARGMRKALDIGAEWMWLFNDDARPTPGSLAQLMDVWHATPRVGMVAAAMIRDDGSRQLRGRRLTWAGRFVRLDSRPKAVLADADVVSFNSALLSAAVVREVGVPREDLFMMMEEHEFCFRVKAHGYRILATKTAVVEDGKAGSTNGTPPWRAYYQSRNHWLVIRELGDPRLVVMYGLRQAAMIGSALLPNREHKLETLRARLKGIRDGLSGVSGRTVEPAQPL